MTGRLALRRSVAVVSVVLATGLAAHAQDDAKPPPCSTDQHRQFDFWVGSWEVRGAEGQVFGHNRISRILGGCVLLEEWASTQGGFEGKSFNTYDPGRGRWHQTWVDAGGTLLELDGGLNDGGAMVLEGTTRTPDGATIRHRITWTPSPDGRVRQLWEQSGDDGATWKTVFDGLYVPQDAD